MAIRVECDCGQEYRVIDSAAGKKMRCKECGDVIAIPAEEAPPPVPASAVRQAARAVRPSAAAAPKAAKSRPESSPEEDDFGDPDYEDYDDAPAPPAPPSKRKGSSARKRPAEAAVGSGDEKHPAAMIGAGILYFVIGLGFYYWLGSIEDNGGSATMPRIVYAVYMIAGKGGVLAIFSLIGIMGVGGGVIKLVQSAGRR